MFMCDSKASHRRVDRVLSFFSSRPNWDPPPPHALASAYPCVTLPPLVPGGGGGGKGGGGVPIRTRGQTLW
jgi:hypothetical protein